MDYDPGTPFATLAQTAAATDSITVASHSPRWPMKRPDSDESPLVALHRCPNSQRHVIEARHRYGLSLEQIAAGRGVTEAAAEKF